MFEPLVIVFFMRMTYEPHILHILSQVGERGISVSALAKHVYNQCCTLFEQPDLVDVHRQVQQYLLKNSKSSQSLIENTGRRGFYRLNTNGSAVARQLMIDFSVEQKVIEPTENESSCEDLSLNLFDF